MFGSARGFRFSCRSFQAFLGKAAKGPAGKYERAGHVFKAGEKKNKPPGTENPCLPAGKTYGLCKKFSCRGGARQIAEGKSALRNMGRQRAKKKSAAVKYHR